MVGPTNGSLKTPEYENTTDSILRVPGVRATTVAHVYWLGAPGANAVGDGVVLAEDNKP